MTMKNLSDDVALVSLPREPQAREELKTVNETISDGGDYDVIIDFSGVEIITSSSLSNLIILHEMLRERGRRLILCGLSVPTKCIFRVAGLDELFHFCGGVAAALAELKAVGKPT